MTDRHQDILNTTMTILRKEGYSGFTRTVLGPDGTRPSYKANGRSGHSHWPNMAPAVSLNVTK
jgi:hypothetical protein